MEIITKNAFENFEPWSGARGLWSIIAESGKIGAFEAFCEELWSGEDVEDVELNDLLWHDGDTVCEALWCRDESWILEHEEQIRNGEDPDEIEAEEEAEEEGEEEEESEDQAMTQLQKLRRHEITDATLTVKHEIKVDWTNWIGGETVTTSHTYKPGDVVWLHTWRPEGMMVKADGAPEMFVMWKYISQMFGEEI